MTVTELIEYLQGLEEEHGDKEIMTTIIFDDSPQKLDVDVKTFNIEIY